MILEILQLLAHLLGRRAIRPAYLPANSKSRK